MILVCFRNCPFKLIPVVDRLQLTPERHADDVDQVGVPFFSLAPGGKQRLYGTRQGMTGQGISGSAAGGRGGVLQATDNKLLLKRRELKPFCEYLHRENTRQPCLPPGQFPEHLVFEPLDSLQRPHTVGNEFLAAVAHGFPDRRHGRLAVTVHKVIQSHHTGCQVFITQALNKIGQPFLGKVREDWQRFVIALIPDAPYPAMSAIPLGVFQLHFIMADDGIVEVSDIQGAVGSDGSIHGPKPWVVAGDEVRLRFNESRGAHCP